MDLVLSLLYYFLVTVFFYFHLQMNENLKAEGKNIAKGERHRIIGTSEYAIIAEIWIHTDKDNPSDEDDIVRIQDDFNRN